MSRFLWFSVYIFRMWQRFLQICEI